jgi:hypothetical protein
MEATIKQQYIDLLTRSEPGVLGYEPESQTFYVGELVDFFHAPGNIERVNVPETQLYEVLQRIIFPKTEYTIYMDGVYFPI